MATFCLKDFDAYGFDLDNTLAKYKLVELYKLCYEAKCNYLIEKLGYNKRVKDDIAVHKDFVCKGLFLDTEKGNLLKLSHDGKVLRGSHGTKMMSHEELVAVYGEDLHWEHFNEALQNVKSNGRDLKYRFFENYFDIACQLVCAHTVDIMDESSQNNKPVEKYDFWKDVYAALGHSYAPSQFAKDEGWFFPALKKEPLKYLQKCSAGVKQWLQDLKQENKVVFLMTSSAHDFAGLVLETIIGSDWQSYFDVFLTNARKPSFFIENNPFILVENSQESSAVTEIHPKMTYAHGNVQDLTKFITKQTGKTDPKVVYFGDSLCSDSFPAKTYANWDVVLVLEEMEAEGYHPTVKDLECPDTVSAHKSPKREVNLDVDPEEEKFILSSHWGSFFYHEEEDIKHDKHMNTLWGRFVSQYNAIAIPMVEYIACMPIDHQYKRFGSEVGSTDGFSPAKPKPLLP